MQLADRHPVLGAGYYQAAIAHLGPAPASVFIFSDDLEWCSEHVADLFSAGQSADSADAPVPSRARVDVDWKLHTGVICSDGDVS